MAAPASAGLPKASLLYGVYRPLVRLAPSDELKEHIRQAFRRNRKLTQPAKIGRKVGEAQELLQDFRRLPSSSELQHRFAQLTAHLAALNALRPQPPTAPAPLPSPEPHLTPSIIYSTPMNPPIHRLKPQPHSTSMLLFRRRQAQQRRLDRRAWVEDWVRDGREEDRVEARLEAAAVKADGQEQREGHAEEKGSGTDGAGWGWEWKQELRRLRKSQEKEWRRNELRVPQTMVDAAVEANRRREHARAARHHAVRTPPSTSAR